MERRPSLADSSVMARAEDDDASKGVVLREEATMGAPYDHEQKAPRSQDEGRRDQSDQGGRVSGGLRSTIGELWRRRRMAMR